ncbi:MAG: hypothetical protein KDF65_07440 [Anaerolineae bacterium]|nr:hypothetical protein [Anaerolineae bacterium]
MNQYHQLKGRRLIALFLSGCLLFNYPVLTLFNHNGLVGGFPLLYVYLFSAWAGLIGLMIVVLESRK